MQCRGLDLYALKAHLGYVISFQIVYLCPGENEPANISFMDIYRIPEWHAKLTTTDRK